MDLFIKKIIGFSILTNHSVQLTTNALLLALNSNPRPAIFHSDNGKEYDAGDFKTIHYYNYRRIHSALKMSPVEFALRHQE